MSNWNAPEFPPDRPGEYRAALDPEDSVATIRRFWNGRVWSNPYHSHWTLAVQEAIKREASTFVVSWQAV